MHVIIEVFHFLPLCLIAMLLTTQILWKVLKKQTIVIRQMDPLLLILSAIGTAAGANAHAHAHGAEIFHSIFDPCFGYAVVSMCVAARMLGFFKKVRYANVQLGLAQKIKIM